uniref:Serpin domain-containing protein n=1 Tax=Gasterosteus aculeatus aculeatus TaxID=481459 RepID=G3PD70_GASAC
NCALRLSSLWSLVVRYTYLADGFNVNFTQTTDSANTIKKYVEDKTNGKIDKLVEDLDPSTVMYLTSYIYYKGSSPDVYERACRNL